jgi:thiol:disulfide interchange protein DsbD
MKTLMLWLFPVIFLAFSPAFSQQGERPLSASGRLIPFEVEAGQVAQLEIDLELPVGYKAYEDQFKLKVISPEDIQVSKFHLNPVTEIFDKFSKQQRKVMAEKATMMAAVDMEKIRSSGEQKMTLALTYQACTDTYCLFPLTMNLDVYFTVKGAPKAETSFFKMSFKEVYGKGLAWAFLFVFVFGLLTSFTPCIYPMIPITLAVLGKEAHARTRWQNFLVSFTYVSGIGVTFSALGVFAASTGALFGSFMSSPWILGFVCLVFFTMSLSMFGFFELQAPRFLRDGPLSHLHTHGYSGAFISGLLAGIIASPCVGPVLVGVLTFVAQTQSLALGFWLLFTYALGMGLLFLALGISTHATRYLPKSGAWMTRVKAFFGVLLLGASLYYLDLLLVSSKAVQGSIFSRILSPSEKKTGFKLDTMNWQNYSDDLLKSAQAQGKPVIIDFRADWCAACLELEEKTFPDQGIQLLSNQFVMIKFDATQDSPLLTELRKRYEIMGLPTIIFINRQGERLKDLTLTEFEGPGPFRERMENALR